MGKQGSSLLSTSGTTSPASTGAAASPASSAPVDDAAAAARARACANARVAPLTRRGFVGAAATVAAAAAATLAGCGNNAAGRAGSSQAAASAGTTQVIIAMDPASEPAAGFDPTQAWGCGEHMHEPLIQSTLIVTDENLGFKNDLATEYACSDDLLTWTFTIRDDVVFSDGEPLTARDVAFTVNQVKRTPSSQVDLSMVEGAEALSNTVVEIHLTKPYNALLYTLAVLGIVPEHAYGDTYGAEPVGSGRYVLEQWDRGQQVIFAANPRYYGEAPKMQRVVVVFMDEDAAVAAVQAGQVDIAYTYATHAGQTAQGYELVSYATVDSRGVSLPVIPAGASRTVDGDLSYPAGNDVTCDLAVRQAINLAVDRQAMIDGVLAGYGHAAYSVSDGTPWASAAMQVEQDLGKARRVLDEAGWQLGQDDVREKDGQRAAFDVWYSSGDSVRQALSNEFANQLAEIGIEVTPRGGSWDEIYPEEFRTPIMWGWGANSPVDLYSLNYSSSEGNYSCYASATCDQYLDAALAQPEVEQSYDYWQRAQWDGEEGFAPQGDATWVWLVNVDHLYFKRTGLNVADQKPHPHGHGWSLANNVDQWTWS